MPAVTVIIVNFNAGPRLARCLAHLDRQTFRDFDTIVFDNASSDGSAQAIATAHPSVRVVHCERNLGFAAANNRAASSSTSEWLAFLNPDAYAAPDWLERLLAATLRHPKADAFGSLQIDDAAPSRVDGAGDVYHALGVAYRGHFGGRVEDAPPEGACFAPCAAAALYRRAAFERLGGFDERFFCYCEDVDLGFRLQLAGGTAVQVADAVVRHEGSGLTGRYSDFTVYHGNRNRIWMSFKNTPGLLYWPLLPLQAAFNLYLLARAFSIGVGPAYFRALRDGYCGLSRFASDRRRLQRNRVASLKAIAGAMAWSPADLRGRRARLRPISGVRPPSRYSASE